MIGPVGLEEVKSSAVLIIWKQHLKCVRSVATKSVKASGKIKNHSKYTDK